MRLCPDAPRERVPSGGGKAKRRPAACPCRAPAPFTVRPGTTAVCGGHAGMRKIRSAPCRCPKPPEDTKTRFARTVRILRRDTDPLQTDFHAFRHRPPCIRRRAGRTAKDADSRQGQASGFRSLFPGRSEMWMFTAPGKCAILVSRFSHDVRRIRTEVFSWKRG